VTDSCPTCSGLRGESSGHSLAFLRCLYDVMAENVPRSSAQSSGPLAQEAYCCLRTGPLSKVSPLTPTFVRFLRRFALSSVRHPFSATPFLGPLLRANSCVLQLRVFCFPGSSRTAWVPPIKQPLALEAEATRFCVPQENGARKRRKFSYVLPQLYNSRRVRWF
jgi:hypothetical protein